MGKERWLFYKKYGEESFKKTYLTDDVLTKRYNQNKTVVDLELIPKKIVEIIKQKYKSSLSINNDVDLFSFFMSESIDTNRIKEF